MLRSSPPIGRLERVLRLYGDEGPAHLSHLREAVQAGRATGNLAHDAHIAALAREHGVREFLTTDKDFARFPWLRARNPFLEWGLREPRRRAPSSTRQASGKKPRRRAVS